MLKPAYRNAGVFVAAALLALASGSAWSYAPTATAAAGDRLPDLGALAPRNISVEQVRVRGVTQNRLRFDTLIANTGAGPLEVFPGAPGCGSGGTATREAKQRIFDGAGGFTEYSVGCMVFHPKHRHWHVEGFTAYRLYRIGGTGVDSNPVAESNKVSFCMLDMELVPEFTGTAATKRYTSCGANATMGISVGWADNYYSGLADQWIVLPLNLEGGDYCLVDIGNVAAVEYVTNHAGTPLPGLIEANPKHASNPRGVVVTLTNGGATVTPRSMSCLPGSWPSVRTTAEDATRA